MVAVVYTTIDNITDARKIAHTLVEEQLVACVNIIPKIVTIQSKISINFFLNNRLYKLNETVY